MSIAKTVVTLIGMTDLRPLELSIDVNKTSLGFPCSSMAEGFVSSLDFLQVALRDERVCEWYALLVVSERG